MSNLTLGEQHEAGKPVADASDDVVLLAANVTKTYRMGEADVRRCAPSSS